ncbi:MAG: hypothetical protein H6751_09920 [Candidatus Omnitrophica bacterium]|nr:hypothetical protein [Candidatus Omnitrophota bacterium]
MFGQPKYRITDSKKRLFVAFLIVLGGEAILGGIVRYATKHYGFNDGSYTGVIIAIPIVISLIFLQEKKVDSEKDRDIHGGLD